MTDLRYMLLRAYATHTAPPPLPFVHHLKDHRDWRDPELEPHLHDMQQFVRTRAVSTTPPCACIPALVGHLARVHNHYSFDVNSAHFNAVTHWSVGANAIIMFPDATIRDPFGRLLLDPATGDHDSGAQVPTFTHAEQRKQATIAALQANGIATIEWLPSLDQDPEVVLPESSEVVDRLMALAVVAVRAESTRAGEPMSIEQLQQRFPRGFLALSAAERDFLATEHPNAQQVADFGVRFESAAVLLWALGRLPALPPADTPSDISTIVRVVVDDDLAALENQPVPRDVSRILDHADFLYRLHWALINAEVHGEHPPAAAKRHAVIARRHALDWLLKRTTDWDAIDLRV